MKNKKNKSSRPTRILDNGLEVYSEYYDIFNGVKLYSTEEMIEMHKVFVKELIDEKNKMEQRGNLLNEID
ncbi:MAG: hypothetical protein FWH18_10755 [Marinilabiliaceae bacterium]|nr:hypothetical protein [Marinilabiliaceae bacterium]